MLTINNFTDEDVDLVKSIPCQAIVAGIETGESGTPHIQMAIYFHKKRAWGAVKKLFPRAHVEHMGGSWEQQDYCCKDGELIRCEDHRPKKGKRSDLESFYADIKAGRSLAELYDAHPSAMIRYRSAFDRIRNDLNEYPFRKVDVRIIWGPGGTGKTRDAMYVPVQDEHGEIEQWVKKKSIYRVPLSENLKWFDGYNGQQILVVDEFRGNTCKFSRWLQLCDGHELKVEVKGSVVPAEWTQIWFTSNVDPEQWWDGVDLGMKEFKRRITEIWHYGDDGVKTLTYQAQA